MTAVRLHQASTALRGVWDGGDLTAELLVSGADHWAEGRFCPDCATVTAFIAGPRYGFLNTSSECGSGWVAKNADAIRSVPRGTEIVSARPPGCWTYLMLFFHSSVKVPLRLSAEDRSLADLLRRSAEGVLLGREPTELCAVANELPDRLAALPDSPEGAPSGVGLAQWQLRHVLSRIESDPGGHHSVAELAGTANLKRTRFIEGFSRSIGVPPHTYLLERRLHLARRKLLERRLSTTTIAMDCGFATPSHFSTAFRKRFGMSPSEFRRLPNLSQQPLANYDCFYG